MKRLYLILVVFTLTVPGYSVLNGQVVNENTNSSILGKKARIVRLEKIFSIDGSSDLYNITDPYMFNIAKDGSLLVVDWNKSLYRFSSSGKYLGNLLKKGEGPGELKFLMAYYLRDNSVIQYCHYPNKIVVTDFQGKMEKEFKIPEKGGIQLHGVEGDTFFFTRADSNMDYNKLSGKYKDFVRSHYYYSWKYGDNHTSKSTVYYKAIIRTKRNSVGVISTRSPHHAFVMSNLKNGAQYYINGFDYQIKKIRTSNKTISHEFGRPFTKIKYFHSQSYIQRMKKRKRPVKKPDKIHFQSVLELINQGNELWVITPSVIEEMGVLVDVFSPEGVYKDKFYLPVPGANTPHLPRFNIVEDKLIVLEKDEDEDHVISLYKIQDRG